MPRKWQIEVPDKDQQDLFEGIDLDHFGVTNDQQQPVCGPSGDPDQDIWQHLVEAGQ